MTLFDANEYTKPGAKPREARTPPRPKDPPPHTVEVVVSADWTYAHRKTPGVIHCGLPGRRDRLAGRSTFCGLVGVHLTFQPGEVVHGCGVCVERGAPVLGAGAA